MRQMLDTVKETVGAKAGQKTVAVAACTSPYHRHRSIAMGADADECPEGGEHVFDGYAHRLVGQRFAWYGCVKCSKASMAMYPCVRR